jgi:hypothetical protein
MKHLLILLCVTTLVSCGIKDKLLNSTSGTLGVPKQQPPQTVISVVDDPVVVQQPQSSISVDKTASPTTPTSDDTSDESFDNWYYVLPFVGLVILGLLVYRLKQQNLKSL